MSWESDFAELMSFAPSAHNSLEDMQFSEFRNNEEMEGLAPINQSPENRDTSSIGNSNEKEYLKPGTHFKRYTQKREHKWTEKEKEDIRNSCIATFVNDYSQNDFYHIDDEKRSEMDTLAELRGELSTIKTLYRQVDKYIIAMRIVYKALKIMNEKKNFLYDYDEFFDKIASGEIYPVGFNIPKLRTKVNYSPEILGTYISNESLDPEDLLSEEEKKRRAANSWDYEETDDETDEEKFKRLFTEEEIKLIDEWLDNPPVGEYQIVDPKYVTGYNDKKSYFGDKKKKVKFKNKIDKRYAKELHKMMIALENSSGFDPDPYSNSYGYGSNSYNNRLIGGAFEPVQKEPNPMDLLSYQASFADDDNFHEFELLMDEAYMNSLVPGTQYRTHQSVLNQKLFNLMEAAGMNVAEMRRTMNLTGTYVEDNKEDVRAHNKKVEAKLVARIVTLNNNPKFKKLISEAEKNLAEAETYSNDGY